MKNERARGWGLTALGLMIGVCACGGSGDGLDGDGDGGGGSGGSGEATAAYTLQGVAQKGPFVSGTRVDVSELDASLVPTGRVFDATIQDDSGMFSLPDVQLASPYVQLAADGFYFDEVAGQVSSSRVLLYALSDVTNASTVNANLLSHLERERVGHLLEQGTDFAAAKAQAQAEVLAMFNLQRPGMPASETLDITGGTEDDAILLAVSAILQGHRTPGELSELLAHISTDLRADGVLDSAASGSALINEAKLLDLAAVRANLEQRYADLGLAVTIGDFESYVQHFIDTAPYTFTAEIEYPPTGQYGPNLLDPTVTSHAGDASFVAKLPRGTSLSVTISQVTGQYSWGWPLGFSSCWTIDLIDANGVQHAVAPIADTDRTCDAWINTGTGPYGQPAVLQLEIYENGATTPKLVKQVSVPAQGP